MSTEPRPAGKKPAKRDRYIGREILDGQFRFLKKIGTGGMGSVYKAEQPEMNRMVAGNNVSLTIVQGVTLWEFPQYPSQCQTDKRQQGQLLFARCQLSVQMPAQ